MSKTLQDWLESSSDDEKGFEYVDTALPNRTGNARVHSPSSAVEDHPEGTFDIPPRVDPLQMSSLTTPVAITPTSAASDGVFGPLSGRLSAREEVREKMKRYLGEAAVTKSIMNATAVVASSPITGGKSFSNLSMHGSNTGKRDSNRDIFLPAEVGVDAEGVRTATATSITTSTAPHHAGGGSDSSLPNMQVSPIHPPASVGGGFREVEVMVVDRGTQTVSSVEVQTDPLPPPSFCTWWPLYRPFGMRDYPTQERPSGTPTPNYFNGSYPFPNPEMMTMTMKGGVTGMVGEKATDGSHHSGAPSFFYGNLPGVDYSNPASARPVIGIDGRPYRQNMNDVEMRYAEGAKHLRTQLSAIKNKLDMLISHYNLPPPPNLL